MDDIDMKLAQTIKRVDALEEAHTECEKSRSTIEERLAAHEAILVELREINTYLRDINAALRVLVAIGDGLKWLAGVMAAVYAIGYALKRWVLS